MPFDWADVQGIVVRGNNYPRSWHMFFSFPSEAAGKEFLTWLRPRLSSATAFPPDEKPEPLTYLGLTHNGLRALGTEALLKKVNPAFSLAGVSIHNPFPSEFIVEPEVRSLGDFAPGDVPSTWWNGKFKTEDIHAAVHIYAHSEPVFAQALKDVRSRAASCGVLERNPRGDGQPPLEGCMLADQRKVHFGYVDGVAQPDVDWENEVPGPRKVDRRHFLLGYTGPTSIPSSPSFARTKELFRNSAYVAFRWMSQDVPAFEKFLTDSAPLLAAAYPAAADPRELLAAKLVGRWRSGAPLVAAPLNDDPSLASFDAFRYQGADAQGLLCPFSSHIRASNPRDQPLSDLVRLSNPEVPRLIRRGAVYGSEWRPGVNDDEDRGLFGMFVCASLERQFQQIIRWMNKNDFSDVFNGQSPVPQDPLFGARGSEPQRPPFRIPLPNGQAIDIPLPDKPFVRSRGTAYFLFPGLTTLDRLLLSAT